MIRQQSPHYAAVTQPEPLDVSEIQQTVIDDGTVLLEFELGTDKSWLWAVTSKSLTSVALPPRREIDAAARALYDTLTARQKRPGGDGRGYAKRVAAADAALNAQPPRAEPHAAGRDRGPAAERMARQAARHRLGRIARVPAVCRVADAGRRADDPARQPHEIVKIPSASVLAVLRQEAGDADTGPTRLGDRRRSGVRSDRSARRRRQRSRQPPARAPAAMAWVMWTSRCTCARACRGCRSRATKPTRSRRSPARTTSSRPWTSTRVAARRSVARWPDYRIVHLATHGVLDSTRPSLSGLVLSLVDERGQRQRRLRPAARHLQHAARRRSGRAQRVPDGARQGHQRRRTDRSHPRVHVRRHAARRRQPVGSERPRDRRADEEVLRRHAAASSAAPRPRSRPRSSKCRRIPAGPPRTTGPASCFSEEGRGTWQVGVDRSRPTTALMCQRFLTRLATHETRRPASVLIPRHVSRSSAL